MTDPIADMLARIRNAILRKSKDVLIPLSKVKLEIANLLKKEGYIDEVVFEEKEGKGTLTVSLKYVQGESAIQGLKRISKPGKRDYSKSTTIPRVLEGMGIVVISTPQGIMSGQKAKKLGLGGELLCKVW